MAKDRLLGRNLLFSGGAAISNIFLIIVGVAAARILHDKAFGEFSFALAIASIFETGIELGISTLVVRNISRNRELAGLYVTNVLGWKLCLSIISMSLMVITVNLLHQSETAKTAAYIMGGAIVLRSYKGSTHAFFQSYERFDLILLTTYVERVLVLAATLGTLLISHRLIPFVTAFALARIPDLAFSLILVHRRIVPIKFALPSWTIIKELQLKALPFGLAAVVGSCYSYIGTVILSSLTNFESVGWYNASYKIYEGLTMFPYLICSVFLPKLSLLYTTSPEKYSAVSINWLRYIILASIPVIFVAGVYSPHVILLFYGAEYLPAIGLLKILLIAAVLMFANSTLTTILNSSDGEKLVLKVSCLGLLVMSAANILLVHRFGVKGAPYSVVISEGFVLLLYSAAIGRRLFSMPLLSMAWRPLIASAAGGLMIHLFQVKTPGLTALTFVAVYIGALAALGTFGTDDVEAIKGLLPASTSNLDA